jgi:hypothetical protein
VALEITHTQIREVGAIDPTKCPTLASRTWGTRYLAGLCLKLFVEIAGGAGDVYAARDAALAVFDPLDDAGGLVALGTIGALGRVHYLLAVCCLGDLSHGNSVSSK